VFSEVKLRFPFVSLRNCKKMLPPWLCVLTVLSMQMQLSRAFRSSLITSGMSLSGRIRVFNTDDGIWNIASLSASHTDDQPISDKDNIKGHISRGASLIAPLAATLGISNPATASSSGPIQSQKPGPSTLAGDSLSRYLESLPLGKDAYATLGGGDSPLITCKVLNGMWQVII